MFISLFVIVILVILIIVLDLVLESQLLVYEGNFQNNNYSSETCPLRLGVLVIVILNKIQNNH